MLSARIGTSFVTKVFAMPIPEASSFEFFLGGHGVGDQFQLRSSKFS